MITRQKIMVTGANGQLGKELKQLAAAWPQFEFIFLTKGDLPIDHFPTVRNFFKIYSPQYLINCAAYTAVDRAESEKDLAFLVNGEAVGVLAAICKEHDTKLIHISTDYVFDGLAKEPYNEDAKTGPQTVYGASKLEGEKQALHFDPDCIIIRSSWVYSEYGKNFVKTIRKLLQEKDTIKVVNDQLGSPTYAADLAEAIMQIIASQNWIAGIYHYCNEGIISWFDFAVAIEELTGSTCTIEPVSTAEYPTPAKRPLWSVLDTTKIQDTFGVGIKNWKESLIVCLEKIK